MPLSYQSKRFVRDRLTGKLLTADGEWTLKETEAHNFVSLDEVLDACRRYNVTNGELLLRYADTESATPICI